MFIEIEKNLFEKIKKIIKSRNKNLFIEIEKIKEIEKIPPAENNNYLENARKIKTAKVKERIKNAMIELKKEKLEINKYQVNKKTNIAYITLGKYFDEILKKNK
jgi:phosphoketolase